MERIYPRFIVLHHTAGHDVSALTINRYHAQKGFGVRVTSPKTLVTDYISKGFPGFSDGVIISIGYHYLIRADGSVEKGRPDFIRGAHCKAQNMNFRSLGIALTGNFDSKDNPQGKKGHQEPTIEQVRSLNRLLMSLMKVYQIPKENILRHRDIVGAATSCPGDRFKY